MVQRQKCWDDVEEHSGVSLDEQRAGYEKAFRPWSVPSTPKIEATLIGEDPKWFVRVLERTVESISSASSILALQECIVIRNANEFMLRDEPIEEEFAALLTDFQRWMLKTEFCLVGGATARQQVREQLAVVVQAAQEKFQELRGRH